MGNLVGYWNVWKVGSCMFGLLVATCFTSLLAHQNFELLSFVTLFNGSLFWIYDIILGMTCGPQMVGIGNGHTTFNWLLLMVATTWVLMVSRQMNLLCFHDSWFWDKVNLQLIPFCTFWNYDLFRDEHAKLMFFFCTLGFMLQWVGPLWVMVQFPHINLSSQIENKKTLCLHRMW